MFHQTEDGVVEATAGSHGSGSGEGGGAGGWWQWWRSDGGGSDGGGSGEDVDGGLNLEIYLEK